MTSRALSWSHAFHEARHRERYMEQQDHIIVRWCEAALDRLAAIVAVVGVRSW